MRAKLKYRRKIEKVVYSCQKIENWLNPVKAINVYLFQIYHVLYLFKVARYLYSTSRYLYFDGRVFPFGIF